MESVKLIPELSYKELKSHGFKKNDIVLYKGEQSTGLSTTPNVIYFSEVYDMFGDSIYFIKNIVKKEICENKNVNKLDDNNKCLFTLYGEDITLKDFAEVNKKIDVVDSFGVFDLIEKENNSFQSRKYRKILSFDLHGTKLIFSVTYSCYDVPKKHVKKHNFFKMMSLYIYDGKTVYEFIEKENKKVSILNLIVNHNKHNRDYEDFAKLYNYDLEDTYTDKISKEEALSLFGCWDDYLKERLEHMLKPIHGSEFVEYYHASIYKNNSDIYKFGKGNLLDNTIADKIATYLNGFAHNEQLWEGNNYTTEHGYKFLHYFEGIPENSQINCVRIYQNTRTANNDKERIFDGMNFKNAYIEIKIYDKYYIKFSEICQSKTLVKLLYDYLKPILVLEILKEGGA